MSTFNRRSYSVASPSSSDIKNYFYTNNGFKGLFTSKNFETVDQNSFEECSNVYVDKFGLLRSRPALNRGIYLYSSGKFLKAWTFGSRTAALYATSTANQYFLFFSRLSYLELTLASEDNVQLVAYKNYIYVFQKGQSSISRYDIAADTIEEDYQPYSPVVQVYRGGVYSDAEKRNLLTNKVRKQYFASKSEFVTDLLGKNAKVVTEGNEYDVVYTKDSLLGLTQRDSALPAELNGHTEIDVSEDNGVIVATVWNQDRTEVSYYLSYDAKTYTLLKTLTISNLDSVAKQSKAYISKDGLYAFYFSRGAAQGANSPLIGYRIDLLSSQRVPEEFYNNSNTGFPYVLDLAVDFSAVTNDTYALLIYTASSLTAQTGGAKIVECNGGTSSEKATASSTAAITTASVDCNVAEGTVYAAAAVANGNTGYSYKSGYTSFKQLPDNIIPSSVSVRAGSTVLVAALYGDTLYVIILGSISGTDSYSTVGIDSTTNHNVLLSFPSGYVVTEEYVFTPDANYNYSVGKRSDNFVGGVPYAYYDSIVPPYGTTGLYVVKDNVLYSDRHIENVYLETTDTESEVSDIFPEQWAELDRLYFANKNVVYQDSDAKGGALYFPEDAVQSFPDEVTALHPISTQNLAVFLRDSVYCVYYDSTAQLYRYVKTGLQVGCKKGSDICTSYDNSHIIFPSDRGLAVLSYEQLTSSTDQVVSYASDVIYPTYSKFDDSPIKLYKHGFWLVCYKSDYKDLLVLDLRNWSWWPMISPGDVKQILDIDHSLVAIISDNGIKNYGLSLSDYNYLDYNGEQIVWNFKSQKLHLGATNYTKHIQNITLNAVLDSSDYEFDSILTVTTYRKVANISTSKSFDFIVDGIRVFVKRLNYFYVNEFQYELSSNTTEADTDAIRRPLSLTSMSIKYRIGGQVR